MKYIEEALQNLTGENVVCVHGQIGYTENNSPISRGNQQMTNKVTVEDSLYINSGRIPPMDQWKAKEALIWMDLILYLEIKVSLQLSF